VDYLCFLLFALVVIAAALALVGHLLWMGAAEILKPLFSPAPPPPRSPAPCVVCGARLPPRVGKCPACGVAADSPLGVELRELEITARRLQALRDAEAVDRATCEQVYRAVEARQQALLAEHGQALPTPGRVPEQAPAATEAIEAATPLTVPQRLDRLLRLCGDVRNLTIGNRQQALAWYRRLAEGELAQLSAEALLALARLLRMAGLGSRSLAIYRVLLEVHPADACAAEAALEANHFALREGQTEEARWFLERAVSRPATARARQEMAERRAGLVLEVEAAESSAAAEVIPEVIPVATAAVSAPGELAPVAVPRAPAPPAERPPRPPRRAPGQFLAAFMEERNILWGELVGGLLIVGCSIALVISLWQTLEQIPYFPFLIFAAITGALFGAGLYTLSHWKLESTSRGLLVIATLLVPLNFFILAGLYRGAGKDLVDLAAEAGALAVFTGLVLVAARLLLGSTLPSAFGRPDRLLALAVLGTCAVQLFIPRVLDAEAPTPWLAVLLAFAAVLCHGLALAPVLMATAKHKPLDGRLAGKLLLLLGLATFALAVCLGFFVYRSEAVRVALHRLAVPVALAGIPVLAAGLLLHRRLTAGLQTGPPTASDTPAAREAPSAAPGLAPEVARAIGTGVALAGTLILLVALVLAWPVPLALLLVSALNFAVLETAAPRGRLPLALVPGMFCVVVGYLLGLHLLHGNLTLTEPNAGARLLALAVSPLSGSGLVFLAVGLAVAGEWFVRAGRRSEGLFHAAGGGFVALLSMALVVGAGFDMPERGALVFGTYAAATLACNLRWRRPLLTYAGSALLLVGLVYGLLYADPSLTWPRLLLLALLCHATLGVGALFRLTGLRGRNTDVSSEPRALASGEGSPLANARGSGRADPVFALPIRWSALVSSCAAAAAIPLSLGWDWLLPLAGCAAWLTALWLVVAWRECRPALFAAAQGALSFAVLLAASRWLQAQPWFVNDLRDLLDPRSLHAHGIALGLLALVWVVARLCLRSNPVARELFNPRWLAVDWAVLDTLIVAQLLLALRAVVPAVIDELAPLARIARNDLARPLLLAPAAWLWLGVLLLVLLTALWERRPRGVVFGLIATAATAAVLAAGASVEAGAANVALRWGLAACYLAGAGLIWLRGPVTRLAGSVGIAAEDSAPLAPFARTLLLLLATFPVLALTAIVAALGFSGHLPDAPAAGSFFAEVGWVAAQVVPLALISLALAGHGAREGSAGYAFAGGLVAVIALAGGYALWRVLGHELFRDEDWVRILQLAAAGGALWLLGWLGLWRRLVLVHAERAVASWRLMLSVQEWLAVGAVAAVLTGGVGWLALVEPSRAAGLFPNYPPPHPWTLAAGSLLGWLALVLCATGAAARGRQNEGFLPTQVVGLTGLGTAALLACTVEWAWPGWGYRALMVGWAVLGLAWALIPASVSRAGAGGTEAATKTALLCVAGGLALALAVRAAVTYHDHLWAAATAFLVALTAATLALRMRQEVWAFVAAAGLVLAASLTVWHANRTRPLNGWWVLLVQVQLITAAASALVWLRLADRIYSGGLARASTSSLLAVLAAACFLGNAVLLGMALVPLLVFPGRILPLLVAQAGELAGWLALLPTVAVVVSYTRRAARPLVVHALASGGLLLGVLAACTTYDAGHPESWLPQHVLTVVWSLLGLTILGASWTGNSLPAVGPGFWPPERRARAAALLGELFPAALSRRWVESVSVLVVALALRGAWGDPARPYWSAAATLTASALLAALALWSRRPVHVYGSGLLLSVVSFLAWKAWVADRIEHMPGVVAAQELFATFAYTQILGLAVASALWLLLDLSLRRRSPPVDLRAGGLPFCYFASLLAVNLLALIVLAGLASDLTFTELQVDHPLGWLALAAVIAALGIGLWDREAPRWFVPLPPLYLAGLAGIGLALHAAALAPRQLCAAASLSLSAYVLLASDAVAFRGWAGVLGRLKIPEPAVGQPVAWFVPAQGLLAALAVGISLWACVAFHLVGDRLTAPLAVAMLAAAAGLLTSRWPMLTEATGLARTADWPRYLTLGLAALACAEAACAAVDPARPAPWLERTALVTATLTLLGVLHGSGLAGLLRPIPAWDRCARRFAAPLMALACVGLLAVLAQEAALYDARPQVRSSPLPAAGVWLVSLTVLVQMAVCIWWAVRAPGGLPGLPESRRKLYVYGAEVLLVGLLVHLRLNGFEYVLQRLGAGWTLAVMGVAFAGVGLGEFFRRRGVTVLADPLQRTGLFLPLLPLLAFLAQPLLALDPVAAQAFPGLRALAGYLDRLAGHHGLHALLWFLLAGLYLSAALTRRSSAFGLLAALAANFGLWVLFAHYEPLAFLVHPQAWLIPLALIVLAAEHVNRERLTRGQSLSVRYLGLLLIYVSSTADMFIAGLGNSVLMPVVLALLSVLGVLAGILLRVRAFLFLGVTFLFLVIFAQIWHAAVDRAQTWVWWASGIVLGALILAVFALFEKRRNDVLKVIDDIKRWQ
jgi:hypothetical protein